MSRGFALPLVTILALAAGLLMVAVLERQGTQRQIVERQLAAYQDQHLAKGLAEVIDAWLTFASARPMAEIIADDGHAFDMELAGGVTLRLFAFDAQGSALTTFAGLNGDALRDAAGIFGELAQMPASELIPRPDPDSLLPPVPLERRYGSPAISVQTAPPAVLRAAVAYATRGEKTEELTDRILQLRGQKKITQADLSGMITAESPSPEASAVLNRVLSTTPTLWRLEAVVMNTKRYTGDERMSRYGGFAFLPPGSRSVRDRGANLGDGLRRRSLVIEWRRLEDR